MPNGVSVADLCRKHGVSDATLYDRFMPDGDATGTARQSSAGYHHALVGAGSFHHDLIITHFSGHYRQMNFIVHLEYAAFLTFSRRVTDLVRPLQRHSRHVRVGTGPTDFVTRLQRVRSDLLGFIHRYHFTHVCNHLQAREMNAMLRTSLDLDGLRKDVDDEIRSASDFAMARQTAGRTASQTLLTEVATLILPATLAAGLGGMNLVADFIGIVPPPADDPDRSLNSFPAQFIEFSLYLFLCYGLLWLYPLFRKTPVEGGRPSPVRPIIGWLALAAGLAFGAGTLFEFPMSLPGGWWGNVRLQGGCAWK